MHGDKPRADESIAAAIALLEPLAPSPQLAIAYGLRARLASNRGLDKEAVEFGQHALALARQFGDHGIESHALDTIGSALLIAGDRAGYPPLEQSLALALEHDFENCVARAYCNLVFCALLHHDFERAERAFRDGVAYCEERGLFSSIAFMQAYSSRLALERGEWSEAARVAGELLESSEFVPVQRVPTLLSLALVRMRRGDPGVDTLLDECSSLALRMGEPERLGCVMAARAEQAWYRGETERAAREAGAGLEHLGDLCIPSIRGELLMWQSRVQSVAPIPPDIPEPYRLMLAGEWRAAASAWERLGMPYEQALALADGPEDALREALLILDKLGAGPLGAIVRRRLRELGARGVPRGPNETTRANPAGLTSREVEVLGLLAEGCSNAQLARRLHRSTKTIDHHVSAILQKLGARSRAEAVAAGRAIGLF
jgi:DNA-binding CsgD family transcriptional regulator/tetratricopeptide (TPR) repeat protein